MPNNGRQKGRGASTIRPQSVSLYEEDLQLRASFDQLRQNLKKAVDDMMKDAERKVAGMNSELRAVRREMEKVMYDGRTAIQQNKQKLTRELEKLSDTLTNNQEYYQRKLEELKVDVVAKRIKIEEEKELPTHECVICYGDFKAPTMFGCKSVRREPKEERYSDAAEILNDSPDSSDDSDMEGLNIRMNRRLRQLHRLDTRYRMRMEGRYLRQQRFSESSDDEDDDDCHYICTNCCKGYAASKVADGALIIEELGFPCPETDCKRVLLWGPVSNILDEAIVKPLEARLASSALHGIDGIEYCKSCHFGMQIERQEQKFFACQNKDCRAVFCRDCHEDYDKHLNKSCDEVDPTRRDTIKALEEFLSAAKFRVCTKCGTRFTKDNDDSCNKMTCRCGTTMCYVCKESAISYDHFERPPRNCHVFCDTDEIDRINLDHAIEDARKEKRYERLLPFLLERRGNLPGAR